MTEQAVQEAMQQLGRNRTVVVVAHRLSTVQDADHIVVIDEGRVVEQGTHEQLLGMSGKYLELVMKLQDAARQL